MVERSGRRLKSTAGAAEDPKEFAASVGEAIRRARQERGLTQVELADAAELSPNYVARLERGELAPSLFVARQLCDTLAIDLESLFTTPAIERQTARRNAR
jgi:transcriptional regulator with XRE-family HTH domain